MIPGIRATPGLRKDDIQYHSRGERLADEMVNFVMSMYPWSLHKVSTIGVKGL